MFRLKSELASRDQMHTEQLSALHSKHQGELQSYKDQLLDSETLRQALQAEASQLRERLDEVRAERAAEEQEFLEELRRKYDRDMATLEEEYRKTKDMYEKVSE